MIQYWGGLPYVDHPLSVSEVMALPRLSYTEIARRIADDFKAAAELLPLNWANTNTLVATSDAARVTKFHALGYMGKNLLYAASPMMTETVTGRSEYNAELCKEAAAVFAEIINLCEQPDSRYTLESWANWENIFHVVSAGRTDRPGGKEVIQNQQIYDPTYVRYTTTRAASPVQWDAGNTRVEVPSHDFTKNYGMEATGLPIEDEDGLSGYDPNRPWTGRDPRFYHDIVYDGVKMILNPQSGSENIQFAQLSNNGRHRHGSVAAGNTVGSVSGYFYKKFLPLGSSTKENPNQATNLQAYHPRLRVADLYLMYAEAAYYGYGSATAAAPGTTLTAQQAIEKIRNRATLPALPDKYYDAAHFMETLMRERAVELAFEGHRWLDLRRWNLAGELKYRQKTAINFDLDAGGNPINISEEVYVTRVHEKKHNWIPFQQEFTRIHEGFPQNPGW
jgi:hypothetical protein